MKLKEFHRESVSKQEKKMSKSKITHKNQTKEMNSLVLFSNHLIFMAFAVAVCRELFVARLFSIRIAI